MVFSFNKFSMCTRPDCFRLIADTDIRRTAGRDRHGKSNFASLPFHSLEIKPRKNDTHLSPNSLFPRNEA